MFSRVALRFRVLSAPLRRSAGGVRAAAASTSAASSSVTSGAHGDVYTLPPGAREAFERDGYVVLRGFLSEAELAPLEAIYDRFMRRDIRVPGTDFYDMVRVRVRGGGVVARSSVLYACAFLRRRRVVHAHFWVYIVRVVYCLRAALCLGAAPGLRIGARREEGSRMTTKRHLLHTRTVCDDTPIDLSGFN